MNYFIQFITYPPVAFLLGVTVAIGIAWCIRKAETRELVNKMMRHREFEFAGRTWIAYAQGMTAREKREWARNLNGGAPANPNPPKAPRPAGQNPPPPKSGRPEPPPSPPPPRDVRGKSSVDIALKTIGLPWTLEQDFKLQLRDFGLTGYAAGQWSVALDRSAPSAADLKHARRVIAQQFARGTIDPYEVRALARFCPSLFPWEEVCKIGGGYPTGHPHNVPARDLHKFASWRAVGVQTPGEGMK